MRLTKKMADNGRYYLSGLAEVSNSYLKGYGRIQIGHAVEKLAEYEDLEEQGLLCRMTTAYGWIPAEKPPKNGDYVLVWYEYFRYGECNCMYQTYGIGYYVDGHWSGDISGHKARCIAWQPLPEPYKGET